MTIKKGRITFTSMASAPFQVLREKRAFDELGGAQCRGVYKLASENEIRFLEGPSDVPCVRKYSRLVLNRGGIWCMRLHVGRFFLEWGKTAPFLAMFMSISSSRQHPAGGFGALHLWAFLLRGAARDLRRFIGRWRWGSPRGLFHV